MWNADSRQRESTTTLKGFTVKRFGLRMVREKDKDGGGGGGGGDKDKAPDHAKEIADLKAQNTALLARFEALEKGKKSKSRDDDDVDDSNDDDDEELDLRARAKKNRDADDKSKNNTKAIEAALRFSMGAELWLKNNASLLPKNISDIFAQAEKEKYDDPFFEVQSNMDLLTAGQKSLLEDYLKLTKNGKQEKAREVYDTIFEPSFEMLRRVKKAEALSKGHGSATEGEDAYKNRLIELSRKHYLGEKKNA
jgi:hypothetical protein